MGPRWPEGTTCKAVSDHWGLHTASYPTKGKVFLVTPYPDPDSAPNCLSWKSEEGRRRRSPPPPWWWWHRMAPRKSPETPGQGWGQRWVNRVALIIRHSQFSEKMVWTHSSQWSGLVTQNTSLKAVLLTVAKMQTTQTSTSWWMERQKATSPYNGIPFSVKMDESPIPAIVQMNLEKHYAEWRKPVTQDHVLHDSICMKCPEAANL